MNRNILRLVLASIAVLFLELTAIAGLPAGEELAVSHCESGSSGGHLVVSLRSEPKTLNPVVSNDISSREVLALTHADLIHIDRATQQTQAALAKSWKVSSDGLKYTLQLRRGLRFSDGVPFDADDVVFSFKLYLDQSLSPPQRDLLIINGKGISVEKTGSYTVTVSLPGPYASAERLFDSIAILPKHILEKPYQYGKLAHTWALDTSPEQLVGLGPFRLKSYVPGQNLTLEKNPFYWKADRRGVRLPYLSEITFLFVGNEDAEVLRFAAGETDLMNRISAQNYNALEREQASRGFRLYDLGPSLEYNFLLFNLNGQIPAQSKDVLRKQEWFRDVRFRQAISLAIDREAMNHIVYQGRGAPIWTHVTPGNLLWQDASIPHPLRSLAKSREFLRSAGFTWRSDGSLVDSRNIPVEFSILTSASSNQRTQMATMLQEDLRPLGIEIHVVPLEFRTMLDRVFQTHDYEAAVMGLGGGDVDPNSQINVWLSSGDDHLWDLGETKPSTSWEADIDHLMELQVSTLKERDRKRLYDRVQEIEAENLPIICLVSPDILVGAKERLGNFHPSTLDSHTLWNADELFFAPERRASSH